jgi:hypothetical protein
MFSKSEYAKTFFDLVQHVQANYKHYGEVFKFSTDQYRNDISFSVAKHIMYGFETDLAYTLPPVFTVIDKDMLVDVNDNKLIFLLDKPNNCGDFWPAITSGVDVHIMNKQSIIRHKDKLLELI